ncbi:hypothetical protein PPUJ20028_09890 [Pseudomonas putida]|uniref:Uncharacterized protein n=1 Tax=Pseudomonas putida TaxID=303 RepID=A0AA37VVR4_PSEPU|nr:hypothetical protein [Pseudomonas putida]GLO12408.1 hypothetical protein PPUJ20028_09890 [Pseudomonas putida]GLO35209.1 hypothetical protein PPUN14671_20420 [Pseudomonas putida]HDS0966602.1 hypothetical protein [Pseudomonas putida]HDS0990347.1 hypothetical protein [Pseudomonas putida]
MKAPKKPTVPKPTPRKPTAKKGGGGFDFNQAMQMASTSVDTFKSYIDLKKEEQVTQRTLIDGELQIRLGEHQLEKAHLGDQQHLREHQARMLELDIQGRQADQLHDRAMTVLESKADKEDRVLKQLESGQITAEEAAMLLGSGQE